MSEMHCPDDSALAQFAAGRVDKERNAEISAHLLACLRCRQVVNVGGDLTAPYTRPELASGSNTFEGSYLKISADSVTSEKGDPITIPTRAELESRFDFRHLESPRCEAALGHLGKYTVRQVVGYGGMGVVFQAHDDQLLRVVAIKVMSRELAASPIARRRFIREARAAAAINHPNVVTIHSVDEHNDTPFLVMEFIQGESLKDRLAHGPRLTLVEMLRIASEVAAGLAAAEARGVIHRDIKPGNIMLQEGLQRVKITDFGLARVAVDNVDLTAHDMGIGTPAYMAPEQLHGGEVDARADLFALGCVMYAMLFGHSPFHGRTALEIARKVTDDQPSPRLSDQTVPAFLVQMIERLLEKSPANRYQSAAEVTDELCGHLAAINQTPTDKLAERLYRSTAAERQQSITLRIALAACAVLIVGYFAVYQSGPLGRQAAVNDRASRATSAENGLSPVPLIPATPVIVTVAKSGTADSLTVNEALNKVGPRGTIQILDGSDYLESVYIRDVQKHAGITIVAAGPSPPTLGNPEAGDVVRIENVPGVSLRGLRLVQRSDKQHALLVAGSAAGVTIDNIELTGNSTKYSLVYIRSAWGEAEQPIVIRDSRIESPKMAVVIEAERASEPVRHIQLLRNLFTGIGTHVQLNVAAQGVRLAGNEFVGGTGLAIGLPDGKISGQISIVNNSFYRNGKWLDLRSTSPQVREVVIENNLILESPGSTIPSKEPLADFIRKWQLSGNHWETKAPSGDSAAHGFAEIHERIEVVSRDPAHPQFMLPTVPLESAESTENGLSFVGAKQPQSSLKDN